MATITLKHVVTGNVIDLPCETWESWALTALKDAYTVVEGSAGCVPCGIAPTPEPDEVVEEAPAPVPSYAKAGKNSPKNTSKESE